MVGHRFVGIGFELDIGQRAGDTNAHFGEEKNGINILNLNKFKILSPGELLVNSLIQLNEQKVAQALEGAENGLEQKIRRLLDAVRSDFAE
jgi:hypothetical protein